MSSDEEPANPSVDCFAQHAANSVHLALKPRFARRLRARSDFVRARSPRFLEPLVFAEFEIRVRNKTIAGAGALSKSVTNNFSFLRPALAVLSREMWCNTTTFAFGASPRARALLRKLSSRSSRLGHHQHPRRPRLPAPQIEGDHRGLQVPQIRGRESCFPVSSGEATSLTSPSLH